MRKLGNRNIPRGILIDRGYVFIRIFDQGKPYLKGYGRADFKANMDRAIRDLNGLRAGLLEKADKKRMSMAEACRVFWTNHASKAPSAVTFRAFLARITEFFEYKSLDQLTYKDVEAFRAWLSGKRLSLATVNRYQGCLASIFNFIRRWSKMGVVQKVLLPEDNPCQFVKKPSEKARSRVISLEEYERLLEVASAPLRAILKAEMLTLLRASDLKLFCAAIYKEKNEYNASFEQGKTGIAIRIPIRDSLRSLLPVDFTNFRKQWEATKKEAGLEDIEFRDLRRTGATSLRKAGFDPMVISCYLGHSQKIAGDQLLHVYSPSTWEDLCHAAEFLEKTYFQTVVKTVVNVKQNILAR